jgi:hypothetical protein
MYLTNCGHAPMLEHPRVFADAVKEWLPQTARRRRAAAAAILESHLGRRRRAWEQMARAPLAVQEATLRRHVARAAHTWFGREHGFETIRSIADYQRRVPIRDYSHFDTYRSRMLGGAPDVIWPGRPCWVMTSGTTAGDKLLPVTLDALASHRRGEWDALLMATARAGAARLLGGPLLFLGGCPRLAPIGAGGLVGDLPRVVVQRAPWLLSRHHSPGATDASIPDGERGLDALATLVAGLDLRLLSGMPSWMVILLARVARLGAHAEAPINARWPNLGVFIHGGVSFAPYRPVFEHWLGRSLEYVEVYPASEAFVAVQTERAGGLTLMLDYDVFYEFIPVEDLSRPDPRRYTVAEIELGRAYAVVLTTPAGLWSILLGDTIRFTARDPLRLQITGRTRHFVNAFGENVIVEEVERAIGEACRRAHAEVVEFTVAPYYTSASRTRGRHEWLVEFAEPPRCPVDVFVRAIDEALQQLNTAYRTKRTGDLGMMAPRVVELPAGTFYRWMRGRGKLGGQSKVPRVTNDRAVADGLLQAAAVPPREPLVLA